MTIDPKALLKTTFDKTWKIVLAAVVVTTFLYWAIAAAARVELLNQFLSITGAALVVMGPVFILVGACYWVFDFAFSFREFSDAIGKWTKNPKSIDSKDATVILAIAIRSGLVFLAISLMFFGGLIYMDVT